MYENQVQTPRPERGTVIKFAVCEECKHELICIGHLRRWRHSETGQEECN